MIHVADAASVNRDHNVYAAFEAQSQLADLSARPSSAWRTGASAIVERARHGAISLWHVLASCGNPGYFEFERRGPVQQRLGPGLSRESDSFWPLSEW
jgi:hypothetical protein